MIKDFKTFSKNISTDIAKLNIHRFEVNKMKDLLEEKYMTDLVESVTVILNTIRDKYEFDDLFSFLKTEKIRQGTSLVREIRKIDLRVSDDNSHIAENIRWVDGHWFIDIYTNEYQNDTLLLSEIETESLYTLFEVLLKHLTVELNQDTFKKLNESTVFFDIEKTIKKLNDKRDEIEETKEKLDRLNVETTEISKSMDKYRKKMISQLEDISDNVFKQGNTLEAYMRENNMEELYDDIFSKIVDVIHDQYPDNDIFNLTSENGYWAFDTENGHGHVDFLTFDDDLNTISIYKILRIIATIPQVSKYINQNAIKKLNESSLSSKYIKKINEMNND